MLDLIQLRSPTLMDLLSPRLRSLIEDSARLVEYSDGQLIHSRGAKQPGLSIVKSGTVQIGILGIDGRFISVGRLRPGESFGEFTLYTDLPRTHDVSSAGNAVVLQMSEVKFRRLEAKYPELTVAILKSSLLRNYLLLEALDDLRRLTLVQRTAKLILSMAYAYDVESGQIPCKQQELADTLGVSRVSLSGALARLVDDKLIELGYREIKLPSLLVLEQWIQRHCSTTPLDWRGEC